MNIMAELLYFYFSRRLCKNLTFSNGNMDILKRDIFSIIDVCASLSHKERIFHHYIIYWHLWQTVEIDSSLSTVANDVVEEYIAEARCLFGDGRNGILRRSVLVGFAAYRLVCVIETEGECFIDNVAHTDIVQKDILHESATSASGFESDAGICAIKDTVSYADISCPARHFRADNESSMTMQHSASANEYVLARLAYTATLSIFARLDANGVIAYIECSIDNLGTLA